MKRSVVSERYAQALFELAVANGITENLLKELEAIADVLNEYNDLKKLVAHPAIDKENKKEIFDRIFGEKISVNTLNFIRLLIDKNRETLIAEISSAFADLVNKLNSRVVAQVVTAVELNKSSLDLLIQKLEAYLDKKVDVDASVDPQLIGGVLVKVGDRIIDGTLKTRFENMAISLN